MQGLDFILSLLDEETTKARNEKSAIAYSGFIAQEVEEVAKKLGYDFIGVDAPKDETQLKMIAEVQQQMQELRRENATLRKGR